MSDQLLEPINDVNDSLSPAVLPHASATLVLGIISIVGCFLWGLPGLVCGIIALSLHKKDKALYQTNPVKYQASFNTAKSGYTCGLIGVILSSIAVVAFILYIMFIVAFISSAGSFVR
jgi:uncharacterized membrane protein